MVVWTPEMDADALHMVRSEFAEAYPNVSCREWSQRRYDLCRGIVSLPPSELLDDLPLGADDFAFRYFGHVLDSGYVLRFRHG
jgi:hypothetical protein